MKWSISRKLNGGFLLIFLLALGSIFYISYYGLRTLTIKSISTYQDQTLPLMDLYKANDSAANMQASIINLVLDPSRIEQNLTLYNNQFDALIVKITEFKKTGTIATQPSTSDMLKRAGENIYQDELTRETSAIKILDETEKRITIASNDLIELVKNQKIKEAQDLYIKKIAPDIANFKESINVLAVLQVEQIKISNDEGLATNKSISLQIASIIIASLILGSLLFFLITKSIVQSIQKLLHAAQSISNKGDLDQVIIIKTHDETGELGIAFQNMTEYLKEMANIAINISRGDLSKQIKLRSDKDSFGISFQKMTGYLQAMAAISTKIAEGDLTQEVNLLSEEDVFGRSFQNMLISLKQSVTKTLRVAESVASSSLQLSSSAQQMNATTQEIASTIQQIAKGSQIQAQRVEETTKIIGEMNLNLNQVANNSKDSAGTSIQSAQDAEKGNQAVQEVIVKMNRIFETISNSSKTMQLLGERSEQIGEIVTLITNIADQTNLLALNAAIEAARAGEAGRGFAVVAEEVRKLAEGSAKAADQIANLIKGTQKETNEAVKSIEFGSKEVQEGREITIKAGSALQEIIQTVEKTANSVQLIAESAQQLADGSAQVVKSIDEVASTAEQAAAGAEQAGASTEQMSASMQEIAASSQELSDMASMLRETVAQFKLGEDDEKNISLQLEKEKKVLASKFSKSNLLKTRDFSSHKKS